jgi:hypothetical protein
VRFALLGFGVLNVVLYAGLMPLWEGFDEPFHYGYVQHLWNRRTLPVTRQTTLYADVVWSFLFAPASRVVRPNLPMVTTYEDYFRLTPEERLSRRRQLEHVLLSLDTSPSLAPNYEAQQVPLAYAVLAPVNALLPRTSLVMRVFLLRVFGGLVAVLGTGLLMFRLSGLLGFSLDSQFAAVFLALSSQMFYATVAHVANDWLTVPLFLLLLTSAVDLCLHPRHAARLALALALAAGLATKAYFLAMIPFAVAIIFLRSRRGEALLFTLLAVVPASVFYIRNIILYHSIDAQQQNLGGARYRALFDAAFRLPWLKSLVEIAKKSLWLGNNSSTTFSNLTLGIMLTFLLAAVVYYFRKRPSRGEGVLLAGMGCFAAALAYNTVLEFYTTSARTITTAPWYVELLWPPALCLLMSRAPRLLRGGACLIAAYIISATYLLKLIPLYAGALDRPAHLPDLVHWYGQSFPGMLDTTALISPAWILALTIAVVLSAFYFALLQFPRPQIAVVAKPLDRTGPQQP